MRHMLASIVLLLCLAQGAISQEQVPNAPAPAGKPTDHGSYMVGFDVGSDLATAGFVQSDIAQRDFLMGFMDALSKQNTRLAEAEIDVALRKIRTTLNARMEAKRAEMSKKNTETANAFLEANKKKPGVTTLPSGLQYLVIKSGTGKQPTANSKISVHYEGSLINGKIFDSSIKNGMPLEIELRNVIDGWKEAVPRMKVGDKWKLFIPPNLGYGIQGTPDGTIGPSEALIFEIELLDVK